MIDGQHREAASGRRMDVVDPSTGQVVATVADASPVDIDHAVGAARRAFENGPWAAMSGRERSRILHRAADLIRERADDLVGLESLDVGKPVSLCRAVDVSTAIEACEYHSALAQSVDGATRQIPIPSHTYARREPYGVVAAITPFNFPLILSSSKIAPALAAGNTVVHKPAPDTPLSALLIADILAEAGVPDGVLNVVTGAAPELGETLLRHPDVDKIAHRIDGGGPEGRQRWRRVAEASHHGAGRQRRADRVRRRRRRAGGRIRDQGFVFNTGQFCMGGPRLLVARPLYQPVVDALRGAIGQVPVGDPFDPATVVGPMAAERHRANVERYVELARSEGATIAVGGERLDLDGGFYYRPTLITGLANNSRVVQEEIFGPVLTVQPFDTEDEAVGLAAGLHTRDVARAHRVPARLKAGIVWVNDWAMLDPAVPFGDVKGSGFGREYGPEGLDAYTTTKSVVISLS